MGQKPKDAEKSMRRTNTYVLHKSARKRFEGRKIFVNYVKEIWSSDLKGISNLAPDNNCYFYIVVVVDTLSKKAYTTLLKTKSSPRIIAAFKSVVKLIKAKPDLVFTDRG